MAANDQAGADSGHEASSHDAVSNYRAARKRRLDNGSGSLASAHGHQTRTHNDIDSDIQSLMAAGQGPAVPPPSYAHANDSYNHDAPLIDAATVLSTVWKWRGAIIGSTILGGIFGIALAMATPKHYTATTSVLVDPREIKLIDRDLTPEFLANEAALSIIDSQLQLAKSTRVIERVVERTNLTQDGEFNGEGSGVSGGLSIIGGLLSGSDNGGGSKSRITQENLREAITTSRALRTFVVNIGASSKDPEKAAILANEVAKAFIEEQSGITSRTAADATSKIAGRIDQLRGELEAAERKVEDFRNANNLVNAQGRLITDDEIVAVNTALVKSRSATSEARARADALRGADLNSVVTGVLPTALVTPALTTFRAQYASLKQQVAAMENQLGPRHPRLENMRAAAQSAANDIQSELNRIVTGAQADLRAAIQNEQQIAQKLAQLKANGDNNSEAIVELRELEREVTAARTIYEAALVRARETNELEAINQGNSSIISAAEAPLTSSSTSRKVIVVGSAVAGFLLSLGAALAFGVGRSLKNSIGASSGQGVAPGSNQGAPAPATPSGGRTHLRARDDDENYETPDPASKEKDNMYPPYAPYGYPAHASMAQPAAPHYGSPYGGYPQQGPVMQPQPYMPYPMAPQMAPQMQHPMAPPMMSPMQYPMSPQMMPHMQQQSTPQVQPIFVPIMQQPAPQPMAAPQPAPAPAQAASNSQSEMDSLRESVRDIRGVLDELTRRRYG
ncbi:MAG: GNVR domain-containing protein [Ahrensia sp.]